MDKAVSGVDHLSGGESPHATDTAAPIIQTKWTLLAYGGLALPLCLAEIPIILYLPAFYAKELHIQAGLVGLVFLCARMWDGLSDLVVGWLSDRSMLRWGRRKPWVVVGAPFLMASTWYLCSPPRGAGFVYLCVWAALFYTAFTAVKIPHLSWGTELATDYVERSRVTAFRETFTMLGNLFFVSVPLIFLADNAPLRNVLLLITLTVLLTVPLTVLPLSLFVPDRVPTQGIETRLLKEIAALARDRVLRRFALARLTYYTEEGVTNSLLLFSFSAGLNLPNKLFWMIFILYCSTLCAMPVTMRLARRAEKHLLLAGGLAINALVYATFLLIPTGNVPLTAVLWAIVGLGNSAMLILPTSILADIIDHGEVTSGERRSGAYVAIDNLMVKLGLALGVGLSFGLLSLVGFDPAATHYSPVEARNIRLLGFGLPCLLFVPAIILYLKHPITKSVQREMRQTIDSRHQVNSVDLLEA